jgi:hypothetical protein
MKAHQGFYEIKNGKHKSRVVKEIGKRHDE